MFSILCGRAIFCRSYHSGVVITQGFCYCVRSIFIVVSGKYSPIRFYY